MVNMDRFKWLVFDRFLDVLLNRENKNKRQAGDDADEFTGGLVVALKQEMEAGSSSSVCVYICVCVCVRVYIYIYISAGQKS